MAKWEYYDLNQDPAENLNVFEEAGADTALSQMRAELGRWRQMLGDLD